MSLTGSPAAPARSADSASSGRLAARGALAGAAGGLLAGVVAALLVEPVIDRAIALEDAAAAASGEPAGGELVSRTTQQFLGLPFGTMIAGVAVGLLFALAYRLLPPAGDLWRRSTVLGAAAFTAVVLIPQVRYPANPPAVGDPDTIVDRTVAYLLVLALGVLVVLGAALAVRALQSRGWSRPVRQLTVAAGSAVVVGVGYAVLPDSGDAITVPADLLWDFRLRSLAVNVTLWSALAVAFGLLATHDQRTARTASGDR